MQFKTNEDLAAYLKAHPFATSLTIEHSGITTLDLSGHQTLASLTLHDCPELETLADWPEGLIYLRVWNLPLVRQLPKTPAQLHDSVIYACPKVPTEWYP